MKDLAFTAGDFAVRLAETCSMLSTVPAEVETLIQKFNRYVSTAYGMLHLLNRYGKTIAPDRQKLRGTQPKTVDNMLSPKLDP